MAGCFVERASSACGVVCVADDRLVYGTPYDSILPGDELRALDTTRVYAARSLHPDAVEERLELAVDPRFALNRNAGGTLDPLGILLTGARARDHAFTAVPSAPGEYWVARDIIKDHVEAARHNATSPIPLLAGVDMGVRVEMDQDGRSHFWSNRDLVGVALRSGLITGAEFEEFLTWHRETVAWPVERPRRR